MLALPAYRYTNGKKTGFPAAFPNLTGNGIFTGIQLFPFSS